MRIPKKYYNKVAVGTYAAMLVAASSFIVQFVYSGWGAMGIKPLLSPLGITAIVMFAAAIWLFIWNLRRPEGLSHEQWLELRDKRQPDLRLLRVAVGQYVKATFGLTRNPILYNLKEGYQYNSQPSLFVLFKDIGINNTCYARIVSDELGDARIELQEIASRLSNKEILNKIRQLFRRTHIARSYQIFLKIYRTQYNPASTIERRIFETEYRGDLAQYIRGLYEYITFMEKGKDHD